jgi:hypothetical protein
MVVFRNPEEYGRSILENSSFLASSENPNPDIHGRGYVARLSGSTTEAVTMWIEMFIGDRVFTFQSGELQLHFEPKLAGWMFDEKSEVSFNFLSGCKVTYHNPERKDTFGDKGAKIVRFVIIDTKEEVNGSYLSGEKAKRIRNGEIKEIAVYLQ